MTRTACTIRVRKSMCCVWVRAFCWRWAYRVCIDVHECIHDACLRCFGVWVLGTRSSTFRADHVTCQSHLDQLSVVESLECSRDLVHDCVYVCCVHVCMCSLNMHDQRQVNLHKQIRACAYPATCCSMLKHIQAHLAPHNSVHTHTHTYSRSSPFLGPLCCRLPMPPPPKKAEKISCASWTPPPCSTACMYVFMCMYMYACLLLCCVHDYGIRALCMTIASDASMTVVWCERLLHASDSGIMTHV
jgi:hypothetical protein